MACGNPVAELPLACALGPANGAERMRRWHALAATAPPRRDRERGRLELRWSLEGAGFAELEALVAAERECCGFVAWTLAREPGGALLTITAQPGRPGDVEAIVGLFGSR
jgi:hypothetical protein